MCLSENQSTQSGLYSVYRRIRNNCCPEWKANPQAFYTWYATQYEQQQGLCAYCHLPGDTQQHYGKYFREGRRGKRLEVDRIESKESYSPGNCVLACYPCNNAKSDVFSYHEYGFPHEGHRHFLSCSIRYLSLSAIILIRFCLVFSPRLAQNSSRLLYLSQE